MGGNMHGCSFDTPAVLVAPASKASEVVRLVGLDSENVGADGGPPEASGQNVSDLAVSSHSNQESSGWTVLPHPELAT
jgi:hypothetical protein